jgi:hypothetical protein
MKFKLLLDKRYTTTTPRGRVKHKLESKWVCIESDTLCNASRKAKDLFPEYAMSMGSPLLEGDYCYNSIVFPEETH